MVVREVYTARKRTPGKLTPTRTLMTTWVPVVMNVIVVYLGSQKSGSSTAMQYMTTRHGGSQ